MDRHRLPRVPTVLPGQLVAHAEPHDAIADEGEHTQAIERVVHS